MASHLVALLYGMVLELYIELCMYFLLSGILDPVNNGQVPLVPIGQPLNLMVHHPKGSNFCN